MTPTGGKMNIQEPSDQGYGPDLLTTKSCDGDNMQNLLMEMQKRKSTNPGHVKVELNVRKVEERPITQENKKRAFDGIKSD